jgi:hypothetical protein
MNTWKSLAISAAFGILAAGAAQAQSVQILPVQLSQDLQNEIDERLGAKEADYLKAETAKRLAKELQEEGLTVVEGVAPVSIAVTIEFAKPNRPTFQQLIDKPGLDYGRSFGVGGASFSARLLGQGGEVLQEVRYRWFETDIEFSNTKSTWSDAHRAMRRFADDTAKATARRAR